MMYWNAEDMPIWRKDERKKLMAYLNKELKPRIKKGELMANYEDKKEDKKLPKEIVIDKKKNNFYHIHRDGKKVEFK